MYSITNIIVGIPITDKLSALIDQWERNKDPKLAEWEDLGFTILYHGGLNQYIGYCGILIGEYDECGEYIRIEDDTLHYKGVNAITEISLKPTPEQTEEAQKLVEHVNPELRKLCPPFGTYMIHSTS